MPGHPSHPAEDCSQSGFINFRRIHGQVIECNAVDLLRAQFLVFGLLPNKIEDGILNRVDARRKNGGKFRLGLFSSALAKCIGPVPEGMTIGFHCHVEVHRICPSLYGFSISTPK